MSGGAALKPLDFDGASRPRSLARLPTAMGTVAPTTGPGTGAGSPRDQYWSLHKLITLNPTPFALAPAAHLGPPQKGAPEGPLGASSEQISRT